MNIAGGVVRDEFEKAEAAQKSLSALTASIVVSYVSRNSVPAGGVPDLIDTVHAALTEVKHPVVPKAETKSTPAVSIRKSVQDEQLTCLECWKSQISLKRHLRVAHSLDPLEYREKWGLRPDYPMVAPSYSARRSALAKQLGLGRKPKTVAASANNSEDATERTPVNAKRKRATSGTKTQES